MNRRELLLGAMATASLTPALGAPQRRQYETRFDGAELPISEGGAWSNNGRDWAQVRKHNGLAYGTQTGYDGYNDSYALLSGFPPDHSASAVIHLSPDLDPRCVHEVEVLLRFSDAPHHATGYECNLAYDGHYCEIVAWNGAIGDFTKLARGSVPAVRTGDVLTGVAKGNVITIYMNGREVVHAVDSRFRTGNPGMGFFRQPCGSNSDYGFSSFTATSL
ncbi:MAG TPA: hypothetical protein VHB68_09060 [Steroidobacteraceae bacterium]|nr:hypothetical protein [Steroidobacteraceae bacterium]